MLRHFFHPMSRVVRRHPGPRPHAGSAARDDRLRSREGRLDPLYELVPLPLCSLDGQHRILAVGERWLALFGCERSEAIGRSITDFMTEASAARFVEAWGRHRGAGAPAKDEFQFRRKSGDIVDLVASFQLERDAGGAFRGCLAALVEVAERRRDARLPRPAQREEAAGRSVDGLARELGHLLGKIDGTIEAALALLTEERPRRRLETVLAATAQAKALLRQMPASPIAPSARYAHVLVVDDDPDVAQAAASLLDALGHSAAIATSAEAALERLGKGEIFDLVLSDVVMPGLGGLGLAAATSKLYPHLPVILVTGYSTELAQAVAVSVRQVLKKPYHADALEQAIRRCL